MQCHFFQTRSRDTKFRSCRFHWVFSRIHRVKNSIWDTLLCQIGSIPFRPSREHPPDQKCTRWTFRLPVNSMPAHPERAGLFSRKNYKSRLPVYQLRCGISSWEGHLPALRGLPGGTGVPRQREKGKKKKTTQRRMNVISLAPLWWALLQPNSALHQTERGNEKQKGGRERTTRAKN